MKVAEEKRRDEGYPFYPGAAGMPVMPRPEIIVPDGCEPLRVNVDVQCPGDIARSLREALSNVAATPEGMKGELKARIERYMASSGKMLIELPIVLAVSAASEAVSILWVGDDGEPPRFASFLQSERREQERLKGISKMERLAQKTDARTKQRGGRAPNFVLA